MSALTQQGLQVHAKAPWPGDCKGRLNRTFYWLLYYALTTFPKRTNSKYICPSEILDLFYGQRSVRMVPEA